MVAGKSRLLLTKESVLERVSEYDIYRHFIGHDFKLGKVMQSPMPGRRDVHPSFVIGVRDGHYHHRDFADGRYSGNCFQFVMQKEMVPNYYAALIKIDTEMGLGIKNEIPEEFERPVFIQPTIENTKPKFFQVGHSSKLTLEEKRYWEQYYITPKELEENEIYAVRWYMIDRKRQPMRLGELVFGYKSGPLWKIYKPYACKDRKWQMNFPNTLVEGMNERMWAKAGVITKSRKDRVVLKKFLPQVVNTQNESIHSLPVEDALSLLANWKRVYLGFDGDNPGRENAAMVLEEHPGFIDLNLQPYYVSEGISDFADLIKSKGPEEVQKFLEENHVL